MWIILKCIQKHYHYDITFEYYNKWLFILNLSRTPDECEEQFLKVHRKIVNYALNQCKKKEQKLGPDTFKKLQIKWI